MKIGIVSDSHGKIGRLCVALELLADRGVEAIVHCGDIGSLTCVDLLKNAGVPTYMSAGNTDTQITELAETAKAAGVIFNWKFTTVPIGNSRQLAVTHGHLTDLLDELIADGRFSYVCHGHTHRIKDERIANVRVINPGALQNPRNPHYPTIALLDTQADSLEYINLNGK